MKIMLIVPIVINHNKFKILSIFLPTNDRWNKIYLVVIVVLNGHNKQIIGIRYLITKIFKRFEAYNFWYGINFDHKCISLSIYALWVR